MRKILVYILLLGYSLQLCQGAESKGFPYDYFDRIETFPLNETELLKYPKRSIEADTVGKYLLQIKNKVKNNVSVADEWEYEALGYYEAPHDIYDSNDTIYLFFIAKCCRNRILEEFIIYLCPWSTSDQPIYPQLLKIFYVKLASIYTYFRKQQDGELSEISIYNIVKGCGTCGLRLDFYYFYPTISLFEYREINIPNCSSQDPDEKNTKQLDEEYFFLY